MTIRTGPHGRAVLLALGLVCLPAWGVDRASVLGSWDGAIVYVPAEQEVEIEIELVEDVMGKLGGLIDIPTKPVEDEPLVAMRLEGDRISWQLRRESGTFPFQGTVSADGNEIRGQCEDRGKSYDFWLRKRDPAAPPKAAVHPPLHDLSPSGAELRQRFEADHGNVRLVMLLSPG